MRTGRPPTAGRSSWVSLDGTAYNGPLVMARVDAPDGPAPQRPGAPRFVECAALIDTGATHSLLDPTRVVGPLGLRPLDLRRMRLAGPSAADVEVVEAFVSFPDFSLPVRRARLGALALPPAFGLLIGMDLLDGTRLAIEWAPAGRWLRWEPLDPDLRR